MSTEETKTKTPGEFKGGGGLITGGLVAAAAGLGGVGFGYTLDPKQALFSYLAAYAFVVSISLGGLLFLLISYAMKASWSVVIRRLTETIAATVPLFLVLFIPIGLGLKTLYLWVEPPPVDAAASVEVRLEQEHLAHVLEHKAPYLNVDFFLGRTVLYFAIWTLFAYALRRISLRRDKNPPTGPGAEYAISTVGIPIVALALTFASFDWLMSLTPAWFSTMFGVYYFAGGILAAIAVLIIATYASQRAGHLEGLVNPSHYYALGRLLFAFMVFWTYVSYAQGFLIYIANKPEEIPWYLVRTNNGWENVGLALIIGHFVIPFVLLLPRAIKFRARPLSLIAAWLLAMQYIDIYWQVMPVAHEHFSPHWLDLAAVVGIGGAAVAFGTWLLRGHAIAPKNDPGFATSLRYHSA